MVVSDQIYIKISGDMSVFTRTYSWLPRLCWTKAETNMADCVTQRHHISSNKKSRGWILFFSPPIGGDYSREAIISNIAHWKSCTKIFCFIIPLNSKKIIISNKLNMGFLSVPNLIHWLIFNVNNRDIRAWIITDQLCCIKERRGVGGGGIIQQIFQLNLKYLHVKIIKPLWVVV